jgi:hypothetical protein
VVKGKEGETRETRDNDDDQKSKATSQLYLIVTQ